MVAALSNKTRKKARKLYKKGYVYRDLCAELGVSKSTLVKWCSDLAQERLKESTEKTRKRRKKERKAKERARDNRVDVAKPAPAPFTGYKVYIYGPETRHDGRGLAVLVNINNRNDRFTMQLAKYRICVRDGVRYTSAQTVDHIDEDKSNDKENNLQILPRKKNFLKGVKHRNPNYNTAKECAWCGNSFKHPNPRRETCGPKCLKDLRSAILQQ